MWDIVTEPLKQFCLSPVKKENEEEINDAYNYITDINQSSKQEIVGGIMSDFKIGQKFRCRYPNLESISLIFGTYTRVNEHKLKFKLFDSLTDDLIVEQDIDASILVDNVWFEISFKPILNSEGRYFYFYLESDSATPSNCVTLFKDDSVLNCGEIWNDGITVDGSIAMKTRCILSEHPLSLRSGIMLQDIENFTAQGTRLFDKNDMMGFNQVNLIDKDMSEMKKSIAILSKNVSELNTWRSKLSGRLGFLRKIKFFNK